MKNARDISEDLLRKLTLKERVDAWMECFRDVADLDFSIPQPELQEELFLIEQTTPEEDRTAFRKCRDTILGTNAMFQDIVGDTYMESNRMMGQIAGLLTVMTVAQNPDLRKHLERACRESDDETDEPLTPQELMADSGALLRELNRFAGAMFQCDMEYAPYWEEQVEGNLDEWTGLDVIESDAIGDSEHSPIRFVLTELTRRVVREVARPKALLTTVYFEPREYNFNVGDCLIPWVEEQVDKMHDLAQSLGSSALLGGSLPDVTIGTPSLYREKVRDPRSDTSLHEMICEFKKWVYADYADDQALEWRPWADRTLEYICSRLDRPLEEVMALLRPAFEVAVAADEGRANEEAGGIREIVERYLRERRSDED